MSKKLFRETALERLSSPEQLDRVIHITSPRAWMSLGALWAAVSVVIAWAFLGRVPTEEKGKGILVPTTGNHQVVSPSAGRLLSIKSIDEAVREGDVVAEIDRKDLEDQLSDARRKRDDAVAREAQFDAADDEQAARERELDARETERLDESIRAAREKIAHRKNRRDIMVQTKVGSPLELEQVAEEIDDVQSAINVSELRKREIAAKSKSADAQRSRDRMVRNSEAQKARGDVEILEGRLERESRVRCPVSGRVVEVRAHVNTAVDAGECVLLVESEGSELTAIVYVAAGTGKVVEKDMKVKLVPSTVKREVYGSMKASVESVAQVPTSRSAMAANLGDTTLADQLLREIGIPLEMRVRPTVAPTDRATDSGYEWTSGRGPPVKISPGTLCDAWVTVKNKRPIEYVIPRLGDER